MGGVEHGRLFFVLKRSGLMSQTDSGSDRYFPSKRDGWIEGVILGSLGTSVVGMLIPLALPDADRVEAFWVAGLILMMDAFMLWVLYGTGYRITQDRLLIRSGPFFFRVPLDRIESIAPTNNLLASPACSADRLEIIYCGGSKKIMVSPSDKAGFLSAIVERCPLLTGLHHQVQRKMQPASPPVRTLPSQGIDS